MKDEFSLRGLDIPKDVLQVFVLLSCKKYRKFSSEYLNYIFKDKFIEFIDVFAGETLRIPTPNQLSRLLIHASIFKDYMDRKDDPAVLKILAKKYNKRETTIFNIVKEVESTLNKLGEQNKNGNRLRKS